MQFIFPLIFFFIIYPILKKTQDCQRAEGDNSMSGLQFLLYLCIVVLIFCGIVALF